MSNFKNSATFVASVLNLQTIVLYVQTYFENICIYTWHFDLFHVHQSFTIFIQTVYANLPGYIATQNGVYFMVLQGSFSDFIYKSYC